MAVNLEIQRSANEYEELVRSLAQSHVNQVRIGMEFERERVTSALIALEAAYQRALLDKEFKAPTPLHVAIEQLIAMVKP